MLVDVCAIFVLYQFSRHLFFVFDSESLFCVVSSFTPIYNNHPYWANLYIHFLHTCLISQCAALFDKFIQISSSPRTPHIPPLLQFPIRSILLMTKLLYQQSNQQATIKTSCITWDKFVHNNNWQQKQTNDASQQAPSSNHIHSSYTMESTIMPWLLAIDTHKDNIVMPSYPIWHIEPNVVHLGVIVEDQRFSPIPLSISHCVQIPFLCTNHNN